MVSDWEVVKLKNAAQFFSGGTPPKSKLEYWGGDIPWISAKSMKGSRYHDSDLKLTEAGLKKGSRLAPKNSILLLVRGSMLHQKIPVGIATKDVAFNQDVKAIVPNEKFLPLYFYYCFAGREHELLAKVENTGIGAGKLDTDVLNKVEFYCPPIQEQKVIANFLGSLDDKIELNRQMNETLEAMAQALFKSWFVDFDPVIDNALAAGNAIPDEFFERAEQRKGIEKKDNSDIQDLFPDEFEFTEDMGWIPKGWVVDDISTLCEKIQSGGTPRRNVPEYWEDSTIPWLTSGEVKQTIIIKAENKISESGLSNSSAKWLTSGATVVAMYGATAGQVAYIDKPLTTNQAVCGLIPKKGYQFFNYVTLSRAVAHFEGRATGSAQQNINKGMIESTRVVVPSSISSDSFEEYCEVIFSKWIKNLHENETLAKLRDTLLPKLMSGELRIPDTL